MNHRDARSIHRIDQARAGVRDGRYDDPAVLDKAVRALLASGDLDRCPACGAITPDEHGRNIGHDDEWYTCAARRVPPLDPREE